MDTHRHATLPATLGLAVMQMGCHQKHVSRFTVSAVHWTSYAVG